MNILAIGNSFSVDATRYLHQIGEAAGLHNMIGNLVIGGCTLETHWDNIENNARKYQFQLNGNPTNHMVSIDQILDSAQWDVVITQKASYDSGWIESYEPFLGLILDHLRKKQPNARIMLHETWAYASDSQHTRFLRYNRSQNQMFERLHTAYHTMSTRYELPLIPSGELIQILRLTKYFNEENGRYSICRDGFHMNLLYGRYALGCLWAKVLWNISLKDNSYIPCESSAELEALFPSGEIDMEVIQAIRNEVDAMKIF